MLSRKLLALACAALMFVSSSSLAIEGDKPNFYQLSYQGKTAYLLGTIHVGRQDFYPLPDEIEQRFQQAGALVLEADVSQADTMALIREYGIKPAEMDAKTQSVMKQYCQSKAALCQALQSYSPWLQATQIEMLRFAEMGYQAEQGVEMYLMEHRGPKKILELESTEFQFKLLASFSLEAQWGMLRDAVDSSRDDMQSLVSAWRTGDNAALVKLMQDKMEPEDMEFVSKILWQRNEGMAKRIVALLSDPLTPEMFIAVGGLHLVGEKSLPEYLQAQGVSLTQCWQQKCQ